MEKDKRLMEASRWERLTVGDTRSFSDVWVLLSKSLIQFSVDGWSCVPSLIFTWGQSVVEVMKIKVSSLKRSHACTTKLSAPNRAAGHHWPTPPLETPGHSQASLSQSLVGSLHLSPGSWCTQGSVCAHQESASQSCVSSGSSMVGLMVTSSKRAYVIPRSAAPRAPAPVAEHCWHVPPQETLKHSAVSVSVGSLGPGVKICLCLLSVSVRNGVWF